MDLNFTDEDALIRALKAGDDAAFKYIYSTYYFTVRKLVSKYSSDLEDVKDVMQETMMILFKNLVNGAFKGNSSLATYIYSIARNVSFKKFNKELKLQSIAVQGIVIESEEKDDRIDVIELCINKNLSEECRKLLNYFYFERRSYIQIADLMDYTAAFAKNKKARCMTHLKRAVNETYSTTS